MKIPAKLTPREARRLALQLLRMAEMAEGCADPMPEWADARMATVTKLHPVPSADQASCSLCAVWGQASCRVHRSEVRE